jgi:dynein heavy chain, axonemal
VQTLQKLFDDNLDDSCYFARKNCPEVVVTVDNNWAMSCMRLIDCFMSNYIETEVKRITPDIIDDLSSQIK